MWNFLKALFATPTPQAPRTTGQSRNTAASPSKQLQSIHELMKRNDVVSVIGLAQTAGYIAAASPLISPQIDARIREIPQRMGRLAQKGKIGATNFAAALREAREVMRKQPNWRVKRVILVSDGEDNVETAQVQPLVRELAGMKVRIDCIAFGPWTSTRRLDEIAKTTRGRVLRAQNLRELKAALKSASDRIPPRQAGGRLAAIAVLVDISGSMTTEMAEEGGKRRIDVAVEAMLDWLTFQRTAYA